MKWKYVKEDSKYYYLEFDDLIFIFNKKTLYFKLFTVNKILKYNRDIKAFIRGEENDILFIRNEFNEQFIDILGFLNIRLLFKYICFINPLFGYKNQIDFLEKTEFNKLIKFK